MSRIAFLGNAPWSVPTLEAVTRSGGDVVLVLTGPPRPGRRGGAPVPTPVARSARRLGLATAEVDTVRSGVGLDALRACRPDFLVVVAYGEILTREVLDLPSKAAVNVHFSLLPELRGPAPVQQAILQGRSETGVTTSLIVERVDAGDILIQERTSIGASEDAGALGGRLAEMGGVLMARTLVGLSRGGIVPRAQDELAATYAAKLGTRRIDWSQGAGRVVNQVRALSPIPAATTRFRGSVLKVFRAAEVPDVEGAPGTFVRADPEGPEGPVVATGSGGVVLLEVAPEGRRRMSGADLVHGFGPRPGEVLA